MDAPAKRRSSAAAATTATLTTEVCGCDTNTLKEHFKKKIAPEMAFNNIHIDHIKPVSKFNLDDEEELL
jgi:hypothetical protein